MTQLNKIRKQPQKQKCKKQFEGAWSDLSQSEFLEIRKRPLGGLAMPGGSNNPSPNIKGTTHTAAGGESNDRNSFGIILRGESLENIKWNCFVVTDRYFINNGA